MVWKLLRQHLSVSQLTGFFLANLCGMVIVLLSVQFYKDVLPVFTQGDSFLKKDYLIINKEVSTLGSLVGRDGTFSDAEMAKLEKQPFTESVGAFQPARFKVSAGMGMQGMQLSTAMFFESVPDRFVDVKVDDWTYRPGQEEIPIIIPRNYLNLYNFGFAQSRNLPQLSESVMGMMTLDIRMSGRGQVKTLKGRIVGFSNRLNTILVPEDFMTWTNSTYGEEKEKSPSRLILEVNNPADERIAQYFQQQGYTTESDKVLSVGLVISFLSFALLMLSIYLLLQKNTVKLETLLLIGYSPARVSLPYQMLAVLLNAAVLLIGMALVLPVRSAYLGTLEHLLPGMEAGSLLAAWITGLFLFILVSAANVLAIRRKVQAIWLKKK